MMTGDLRAAAKIGMPEIERRIRRNEEVAP